MTARVGVEPTWATPIRETDLPNVLVTHSALTGLSPPPSAPFGVAPDSSSVDDPGN